ncbi:MAG: hypothetical protein KC442_01635, partial [Thermomicrobiales bacterium]|nr:hypothetical protein [Thermomicrobiales bacterium]
QLPLEVAIVSATTVPATSAAEPAPQRLEAEPVTRPAQEPAPPSDEAPTTRRVTSLRERVRNPDAPRVAALSSREPSPAESPPAPPEPAPITPIRGAAPPVAPSAPAAPPPAAADAHFDVGQIIELWPRIRNDVKAVNRRIEALLSEVDPVAVSVTEVTLAVPYPFHRDKLNSDDVRQTVSEVLSRNLGRNVTIACVLRGEYAPPPAAPRHTVAETPSPPRPAAPAAPTPEPDPADDADEARVLAARNLLDADEIDGEEFARLYGDAASWV